MRAFKNWRCRDVFPATLGYMDYQAKKSCIRRRDHEGPHRNRFFEWDQDLPFPQDWTDLSVLRPRKTKRPAARAGRS